MEIKIKSSKKSAFTFIELVIVVAIMAMMTAVLMVNQQTGSAPKYDVDTAAREMIALIHQQQTGATGGQELNGNKVCGVGVEWNNNAISTIYIPTNDNTSSNTLCVSSGDNWQSGNDLTYGQNILYKNVNIDSGGVGWVFFKLPFAGMSSKSGGSYQQIVLTSTMNSNVIHTICVYADSIKDAPGSLSCI